MENRLPLDQLDAEIARAIYHELRTPLTVIVGYADLLLECDELSVAERREVLERVQAQCRQALETLRARFDKPIGSRAAALELTEVD